MDVRTEASTDALRGRIRGLISESERLFLRFADTYPAFSREMTRSLQRSSETLALLGSGSSMEESLRSIFDDSRIVIKEASGKFLEMSDRDHALLLSLNRGIETLANLDRVIARIKDDSIEMELISLNAMTVALKSGTAGKAFSVITEELKRLSSRTIILTDLLTSDGKVLQDLFRQYRAQLESLEKNQKDLFTGLEERIRGAFLSLETSVRELGSSLSELVEKSRGVEPAVRSIMETIQLQDILRQSLDHVVMALDEIDGADASSGDDYAFIDRLSELALAMVADVRSSAASALDSFRLRSHTIQTIVADGEKRRRQFLESSAGAIGLNAIARTFQETSDGLSGISRQVDSYMNSKAAITANGGRLASSVEALEARFRDFSKILSRFKTIDVASRIEVAKQQSLRSMTDTVAEMSSLTERIAADVDEALSTTRDFIDDTKEAMSVYAGLAESESSLVLKAEGNLKESLDKLSDIKNAIQGGAAGFSLFTEEFVAILRDSDREIASFESVVNGLDAVSSELKEFRQRNSDASRGVGAATGGADLSGRLKEVIDRFTIYAHKQVAADIGGFHIEGGADLGEVTLF